MKNNECIFITAHYLLCNFCRNNFIAIAGFNDCQLSTAQLFRHFIGDKYSLYYILFHKVIWATVVIPVQLVLLYKLFYLGLLLTLQLFLGMFSVQFTITFCLSCLLYPGPATDLNRRILLVLFAIKMFFTFHLVGLLLVDQPGLQKLILKWISHGFYFPYKVICLI